MDPVNNVLNPSIQALYMACVNNEVDKVKELLKSMTAADLSLACDSEGNTPLHGAAKGGHVDVLLLLLDKDPAKNVLNAAQKTPADVASNAAVRELFREQHRNATSGYFFGDCAVEWVLVEPEIIRNAAAYRHRLTKLKVSGSDIMEHYINGELKHNKTLQQVRNIYKDEPDKNSPRWLIKAYTAETDFYRILNQQLALMSVDGALGKPLSTLSSTEWEEWTRFRTGPGLIVQIFMQHAELNPFGFSGPTFRGMKVTEHDLAHYCVGSTLMTKSFQSTSEDPSMAISFALNISSSSSNIDTMPVLCKYNLRGKRTGLKIADFSVFKREKEVLVMPFTAFQVVKIKRPEGNSVNNKIMTKQDLIEIDLEEVVNDASSEAIAASCVELDTQDAEFLDQDFIPALRNNEL